MNWSLIPMPAPEELAGGYVPSPSNTGSSGTVFSLGHIATLLFAVLGFVTVSPANELPDKVEQVPKSRS